MTAREQLDLANTLLDQDGRRIYKVGETSSDGSSGLTVVDSDFGAISDAWNNAEIRITSGAASGQRREVADYQQATGIFTVVEAFTDNIASGISFEVGEKGFVSDHQIIELFTAAQTDIATKLPSDAFIEKLVTRSDTGSGGLANVPTDLIGPPHDVKIGGKSAIPLAVDHEDKLNSTAFGTTRPRYIYKNTQIVYSPSSETDVKFEGVPTFSNFTFTSGSALPVNMHLAQVLYAVKEGWAIKNRLDMAQKWEGQYQEALASIAGKFA